MGDRFVYDGWVINEYGYLVPSSKATYVWNVRATELTYGGRAHTILLVDSVLSVGDTTALLDSIYLAVDPNGDLYHYGFRASLAAMLGAPPQAKQWDRIAAFSLGPSRRWDVGAWDSAGVEKLSGEIHSDQALFSINVNGVQTVFPGYRVNLESPSLGVSYTLSSSPPAILSIEVSPLIFARGRYRELKEISSRKWINKKEGK